MGRSETGGVDRPNSNAGGCSAASKDTPWSGLAKHTSHAAERSGTVVSMTSAAACHEARRPVRQRACSMIAPAERGGSRASSAAGYAFLA
jgi:hypothetical protein